VKAQKTSFFFIPLPYQAMKRTLTFFYVIFGYFALAQTNPNNWDTAWVNSYGGPNSDIGRDVKETNDKGFVILGTTNSFGNGNTSFYVVKTDSLGMKQWSKSIGSSNNDLAYSVEIGNDNGYFLCGITNWDLNKGYDGFVIKTDILGNVQWTKNYGWDDWDFFYGSCKLPDGGLVLCGESYSKSQGGTDAYIVRINANGDTLWTKMLGTAGNDCFYNVEYSNNRIYLVGKRFNVVSQKSDAWIYKMDILGNGLSEDLYTGGAGQDSEYRDICISSSNNDLCLAGRRATGTTPFYILRKVDTTSYAQLYTLSSTQNFYYGSIAEGNMNDIYTLATQPAGLGGLAASYFRFSTSLIYLYSADFGGIEDDQGSEFIRTSKGYAFVGTTKSYGNSGYALGENIYFVVFNKKDLVANYFLIKNEVQDNLPVIGIKETGFDQFPSTIFPNPVIDFAILKFNTSGLDGKYLRYQIFDLKGALVHQEEVKVSNQQIVLNRSQINSGLYTYKLKLNALPISSGKIVFE
jgi:hypothetical protein